MSISEQYIYDPSTVAEVDNRAIHEFSMPGIELMEKAERIFNSMTFDIKNMIDIMKLEIE